jgi:hypothetical protein
VTEFQYKQRPQTKDYERNYERIFGGVKGSTDSKPTNGADQNGGSIPPTSTNKGVKNEKT